MTSEASIAREMIVIDLRNGRQPGTRHVVLAEEIGERQEPKRQQKHQATERISAAFCG